MIKIQLHSRLGNQLFQMAYAYIVSKELNQSIIMNLNSRSGYCLQIIKPPVLFNFLPEKCLILINKIFFNLIKTENKIEANSCLEKNLLPKKSSQNLLIEGYFQDGNFYSPYQKELKKIFTVRKKFSDRFKKKYSNLINCKNLVIHLRLTDYKTVHFKEINGSPQLTLNWYLNVLSLINIDEFEKIIVISDDISEAKTMLQDLPYDMVFISDVAENDFQFLLHADCLIIPNSSFAWWGAFLNEKPQKKVFAPKNWAGYNVGIEYPTGIMIEEFIWV